MSDIVITGMGLLSAAGLGRGALSEALRTGTTLIRPITGFDVGPYPAKLAGEVNHIPADELIGGKGLRLLDRTSLLAACAARLAVDEGGLELADGGGDDVGVVLGTAMGSLGSLSDFVERSVCGGLTAVNPALFPNTVKNAPASQVCIRLGIRGLSATISSGLSSGLEALAYAADLLRAGRARAIVAGGAEEFCEFSHAALCGVGLLSTGGAQRERAAPFDRNRSGAIIGEGAAMLLMEREGSARARGAPIVGRYLAGSSGVDPSAHAGYPTGAQVPSRVWRQALASAVRDESRPLLVCSGANGSRSGDLAESAALAAALPPGEHGVFSIKGLIGETLSASGPLQVAAAIISMDEGILPPTVGFSTPDPSLAIPTPSRRTRKLDATVALVTCLTPQMKSAACVVARA